MPVCEIRVVDPATRRELATGEVGLLLCKGQNVMKCYVNNPSASLDPWLIADEQRRRLKLWTLKGGSTRVTWRTLTSLETCTLPTEPRTLSSAVERMYGYRTNHG